MVARRKRLSTEDFKTKGILASDVVQNGVERPERPNVARAIMQRQSHYMRLGTVADPLLNAMHNVAQGAATKEAGTTALQRQLLWLRARHLFVTHRQRPLEIARELGCSGAEVYDWVSSFGWQDERERLELHRRHRYAELQTINHMQVERHAVRSFQKIELIYDGMLDAHMNGEIELEVEQLGVIANMAEKKFKICGSITGSDKVGERLKVEMSHEIKRTMEKMISVATTVDRPKQVTGQQQSLLGVTDAEFEAAG